MSSPASSPCKLHTGRSSVEGGRNGGGRGGMGPGTAAAASVPHESERRTNQRDPQQQRTVVGCGRRKRQNEGRKVGREEGRAARRVHAYTCLTVCLRACSFCEWSLQCACRSAFANRWLQCGDCHQTETTNPQAPSCTLHNAHTQHTGATQQTEREAR